MGCFRPHRLLTPEQELTLLLIKLCMVYYKEFSIKMPFRISQH